MFLRRSVLCMSLLAATASGCRFLRPVNPDKPAARAAPKPAAAATKAGPKTVSAKEARAGLTDPSIAAMMLALNNTDISYARLAPTRAERPDVKAFAQRMLSDHAAVNGLVTDLLNKLNLAPVDNVASLDMRDESASRRDVLRELSGYAFDSTYIENEVVYHEKFLVSLDSIMLPSAKNAELRGLLMTVRPAVAAHLAHAEQVRVNVVAKR